MKLPALLPFLLASALCPAANAKPVIRVTSTKLQNIGIARGLEWALSLIPHNESLTWTIVVHPHEEFQKEWAARKPDRAAHSGFPQRCWTYSEKLETHCDADWVLEFSGMAKAGTLAHEYGHILCGPMERDADWCGGQLMHGVEPDQIRQMARPRLPTPG